MSLIKHKHFDFSLKNALRAEERVFKSLKQSPTCLETTQQFATFLIQSRKKLEEDSVTELQKSPKSLANIKVHKSGEGKGGGGKWFIPQMVMFRMHLRKCIFRWS